MPQVVDHLAQLTAFRSREAMDVALVGALKDILDPLAVAIYRCAGDGDDRRWITRARVAAGEGIPTADPLWADLASLPRLDAAPERLACLMGLQTGEQPAPPVSGAPCTSLFPMATEHEVVGVLEVISAAPLAENRRRLIVSILRIYRNFEGLLDYSERDTLTGLLNRKTFDEAFLRMATTPAGPGSGADAGTGLRKPQAAARAWLGMIDIDHFKLVNDNHGHLIGDEVLLLLARLMRGCFRFNDQLYRFGGEEFVVLMRCESGDAAALAFERLRGNVERHAFPRVDRVTVSIGFTEVRSGDAPSTAFERADQAVYHAKQNGRNRVANHAALVAAGILADNSRSSDVELF